VPIFATILILKYYIMQNALATIFAFGVFIFLYITPNEMIPMSWKSFDI